MRNNHNTPRLLVEYVLPLRWDTDEGSAELTDYLYRLSDWVDVTVVDGSPAPLFEKHAKAWKRVRHLRPEGDGLNGKARGAMTGIRATRHDLIIIADDDVRYTLHTLLAVFERLGHAGLVRPQNVFEPAPWHARWDTGRTLINRAFGGDYSGTLALTRHALPVTGYDTNVLFENLELERTVRAHGGTVLIAYDIYIPRRPPTTRRFIEQRRRQAYDSLAQPLRFATELALLPIIVWTAARPARRLPALLAAILVTAAWGRYRGNGPVHFPASTVLTSLAWVLERALTAWTVPFQRLRGGILYRGTRIVTAAHSTRQLREHPHAQR